MLNVRIITIMPKKLTTEEWINKARIKHGDKYDYSKSVYTGSRDRIIITCPKHGDFTAISGLHISRGDGCPECASLAKSSKLSLSNEEFINRLRDMFGDNYDYSKVKYNGTRGYVTIVCPKHGEFWQTPNSHIQGSGCPSCSSSKGEEEVCNILLSNGIKFIREYTIQVPNEINTSGHAYIDFYLPEYNTFVEYNGIQHYNPKMAFGGSFKFERQQARDEYVRQYCKDNNIKLIEIRYDEDVWEVLTRELLDNQTTNKECK